MEFRIINYDHYAVYQISRTYSSYNWKFVLLDKHLPQPLALGNHQASFLKRSILLRNLQIYKTMLLFSLLFFSPFGKCNFFMRCSDYLQLCFKVYSIEIAIKLGNLLNILLQKLPLKKRQLLLLSHFSHVRLCVIPQTASHQAPLSLGFSRQEHWSGLPFPSPVHESEK